jgi:hypothetical protein
MESSRGMVPFSECNEVKSNHMMDADQSQDDSIN